MTVSLSERHSALLTHTLALPHVAASSCPPLGPAQERRPPHQHVLCLENPVDSREGTVRRRGCPGSRSPVSTCSRHRHRPVLEIGATGHILQVPTTSTPATGWGKARNEDGQWPVAVTSHICLCHHRAGTEQPLAPGPGQSCSVASHPPCLFAVAHSPCHPEDTLPSPVRAPRRPMPDTLCPSEPLSLRIETHFQVQSECPLGLLGLSIVIRY